MKTTNSLTEYLNKKEKSDYTALDNFSLKVIDKSAHEIFYKRGVTDLNIAPLFEENLLKGINFQFYYYNFLCTIYIDSNLESYYSARLVKGDFKEGENIDFKYTLKDVTVEQYLSDILDELENNPYCEKNFYTQKSEEEMLNKQKRNKIYGILLTAMGVLLAVVGFLGKKDSILNMIIPLVFGITSVIIGIFLIVKYMIYKKNINKK